MAHREKERRDMCKILDEYIGACAKAGVQAEKLYIEMGTVESGLVELIFQHKIERLVMGAAADNRYTRKMMEPKSKKANFVRQYAPPFCHIWFICKGRLIYTREGTKLSYLNEEDQNRPANAKSRLTESTSEWSTSISRAGSEGSFDDCDRSSTFSLSQLSVFSRSAGAATSSTFTPFSRTDEREPSFALPPRPEEKEHHSPSPNLLKEGSMNDGLYDQLDQAIAEAETAKREAFQESMKRRKAEKEAIEAIRKANAAESLYCEEFRRRKELEEELVKVKEELESRKQQHDMTLEELRVALDEKSLLKTRVEKSDIMGKELEHKILSALEVLQNFRKS